MLIIIVVHLAMYVKLRKQTQIRAGYTQDKYNSMNDTQVKNLSCGCACPQKQTTKITMEESIEDAIKKAKDNYISMA